MWPVMLTPFHEDGAVDWHALGFLVEWYVKAGAAGLFAVSGSSEVYQLTHDERMALARRVVRAAGSVPVVASAIDFGPVEKQAAFVRMMADTGVRAVVLGTCQLAGRDEDDDCWRKRAEKLFSLTGEIPLGLYEIPTPYKRLLSLELLRWASASGRVMWFKDTSCAADVMAARIRAAKETMFRIFNAHTPTLLDSLRAGGHGFSGIGANYCPALYVRLCNCFRDEPEQAERIQAFLTRLDSFAETNYPASAKAWLSMAGLPVRPVCRVKSRPLTREDTEQLARYMHAAEQMCCEVGVYG
ncbi:MAG: dihydrodipicolinate synthase family protein [Armatimonadota bacterium]